MWTYALNSDRTRYIPSRVTDRDAVAEWLRAALHTSQGEQPHLPPTFGVDIIRILAGEDPTYYLQRSLEDTCELRDDVSLESCVCWQEGVHLYASAKFQTVYGDIEITNVHVGSR